MRIIARIIMFLLARVKITGSANLPSKGPLILVGNHVAMVEVILMATHLPYTPEILGVGDIPVEPRFASFVNRFGYIPIKRGSMDREGLTMALDVLKQGGIVGIFPEGGIWETSLKGARTGVAWLSKQSNAPLLPIGFGGMVGAFAALAALRRPRVVMNIGSVIPPVETDVPGKSRKEALQDAADSIMDAVSALIPPEEKQRHSALLDERFGFTVTMLDASGQTVMPPPELAIEHGEMLAKFFYRPVLLDAMRRNLKLGVGALEQIDTERNAAVLGSAAQAALDYLEKDNPFFLTYRFGYEEGGAMQAGLAELRALAAWAESSNCSLHVQPSRRYYLQGHPDEILEAGIRAVHEI